MKKYEFLDKINFPSDLKKISESQLQKVADELREELIDAVSVTGGHLGASLGVVELSVWDSCFDLGPYFFNLLFIFKIKSLAYLIVFL